MSAKQTPKQVLLSQGKLDKDIVAVTVGGKVVDLHTPIEVTDPSALTLTPIRATDPKGLEVIRHSTAHVMADAVQRLFPGTKVTIGPAIEDGFYYDFDKPDGPFTEEDLGKIEETMRAIVKEDTEFRREVIARDAAIRLFREMGETFKVDIIERRPEDEELTLYRHGKPESEWVDFCSGPHVPRTGLLKAVKLTSVAGAYWRGDERNPMLQRIYGTAFASQDALKEHLRAVEEAKARDHRKVGKELDLFLLDQASPAMPFFLPKGAFVYNRLVEYMRELYFRYGYEEVITPQAFDPKLFRTSGHLGHYNENMYRLWTEDILDDMTEAERAKGYDTVAEKLRAQSFALKPMNCPSHCVIFGSRKRSYRELPWRVADFGRLHRYERGGVIHGLSRVRSFCQDDAHIFCTEEQVGAESKAFLDLFYEVFRTFGFERIDVKLATRPEKSKRMGSDELWDHAEASLAAGLKAAGIDYEIAEGEGAFYGPKLEFHVHDALKRSWQLGTLQYDPNLPERFDLSYVGADGKEHRPVMLHRAVLGSLERFFSVYLEHCGGNFPTWLSPKQAIVLTVSDKVDAYALETRDRLRARGIRVDIDYSADKLGAKIRNARLARYPYLCVVGLKEAESGTLGVRSRDRGELGAISRDEFAEMVLKESVPGAVAPAAPAVTAAVAPGDGNATKN
ncbi:threonine--tRNA ligase [Pendulispora albinea]|uniref:Threonine--tRNA ligase n=1 Tax=Pendulispora albinea TaxID=2741071 RepID=A0ABZ2LQX3_9BACT